MQFKKTSETRIIDPFLSKLEDIPGGITVSVADTGALTEVKAGTPVGKDSNDLYHVVKQAVIYEAATNSATELKVKKGHALKVGDRVFSAVGGANYAISAITTTESAYDTITIATTLGVVLAEGAIIYEGGTTSGADKGGFRYTPSALVGAGFDIEASGNHFTQGVVRGSVVSANLPNGAGSVLTAALPLIRFV